ncbi:hypothetical protein [Cupriavidus sp. CuC1]|uniref:hypothetical protein n=1 Tax=Cupriavidus sp. CuC1 TaxID=3373131 RepID=UPI0037D944FF
MKGDSGSTWAPPPRPEVRSLALHKIIAEKLRADPSLLRQAISTLNRWKSADGTESADRLEWRELLQGPVDGILAILVDPGPRGIRLRNASPFTGVLTNEERMRIIKAWRAGELTALIRD